MYDPCYFCKCILHKDTCKEFCTKHKIREAIRVRQEISADHSKRVWKAIKNGRR